MYDKVSCFDHASGQDARDLAATVQAVLEETVLELVHHAATHMYVLVLEDNILVLAVIFQMSRVSSSKRLAALRLKYSAAVPVVPMAELFGVELAKAMALRRQVRD